jgi:hypothetical protein
MECQAIPRFLDRLGFGADVRSMYDRNTAFIRD